MASSTTDALKELSTLIETSIVLIQNIEGSLQVVIKSNDSASSWGDPWVAASSTQEHSNQLDCMALVRDSASLVKAHSTRISLFMITDPFTPTAITKVLRPLIQDVVPALASAVQQCHADLYTKHVRRDLAWRCSRVLKELKKLIQRIPKDGKVLLQDKKNGNADPNSQKCSIAAAGVLWSVCDEVISFANLGMVGHLVQRAEHFRSTLKDIMEELKKWSEEQDEDEDEEDGEEDVAVGNENAEVDANNLAEDLDNTYSSTQAMLDEYMNSTSRIPHGDPEKIRERLETTLRRIRLTVLLFQALIKRRLKMLPKLPLTGNPKSTVVSRLDEVMPLLRRITDRFDSLAVAFYDLNSEEINKLMDQCFFDAFNVSELLAKSWDEQEDGFTEWVSKFQAEIKKNQKWG